MTGEPSIIQREAARALILTPAHEALLMRVRFAGEVFWITPGGGMAPGEDIEACLRRELREELGLERFTLGPYIGTRQHAFDWTTGRIHQRERFHVITVARFEPRISDAVEAKTVDGFRWWPAHELASAPELLAPRSLAAIVTSYIHDGAAFTPFAIDDT